MKKLFLVTLCLLQSLFLFGAAAKYESEQYDLYVSYNDVITPGDAIFVRMKISSPKSIKKEKDDIEKKATLQLIRNKKVIEEVPFYSLSKSTKQTTVELLCGLPVSMWLSNEGEYSVKVIFTPYEGECKEFILPTTFQPKEFIKDVIELDPVNTAIKTNNSPKRSTQINKLNQILYTTNPENIYSLAPFVKPVDCERITSNYGERRVYKYSNGKSSQGNPHNGIDYGVPEGTKVCSCAAGKVVMAENRISTGWSIVIEHLPGLYSLYYHLSSMEVEEGDTVGAGDLIGLSGKTGLATGPHLHWEVRLNAYAINPDFFLSNFTFR